MYIVFFTQPSSVKLEHRNALLYKDKLYTNTQEATGLGVEGGRQTKGGEKVIEGDFHPLAVHKESLQFHSLKHTHHNFHSANINTRS